VLDNVVILAAEAAGEAARFEACGPPEEASWLCDVVFSVSGNGGLARAADVLVAKPLAVAFILVLAYALNHFARRGIRKVTARLKEAHPSTVWDEAAIVDGTATAVRRAQRAEAIGTLLRSIVSFTIWTVAALMALGELGLNLGPLIAGAGVVGVALGFGAQSLVKDFLSGIFMLVEDQFGVGDVIDAGEATGTVESVSLRTTRLRDVEGIVWHIPNGEIRRVGNKSQEWSRALLDVPVPYETNLKHATELIQQVADDMSADSEWSSRILRRPEVWGVERFDADSVAIRTVLTTTPSEQWKVSRELRHRLKEAFDAHGIEIPYPQRTVWVRHVNEDGEVDMRRSDDLAL
jgi:moderate conductance mechanosensitive channel